MSEDKTRSRMIGWRDMRRGDVLRTIATLRGVLDRLEIEMNREDGDPMPNQLGELQALGPALDVAVASYRAWAEAVQMLDGRHAMLRAAAGRGGRKA